MIIVIIGPTGIGKTSLSLALAKHYRTEIISGDSVQVYKQLNIGSAKISDKEKNEVVHHCIDILEPTEDFSVALFQRIVREKIKDMEQQNKIPIIVGGTGLYIKSVLYDYNFSDAYRDQTLVDKYEKFSSDELHQILEKTDPLSAEEIHPNNRKRVIQAIIRSSKNKVSDNKNKDVPLYEFVILGLTTKRDKLYEIINNRVDKMIQDGLEKEVRALYDANINTNSVNSIGYKEFYSYFNNEINYDEAVNKIKQHSRNLAKRQYTFFNNQFLVNWIDVKLNDFNQTIDEAINIIEKSR